MLKDYTLENLFTACREAEKENEIDFINHRDAATQ